MGGGFFLLRLFVHTFSIAEILIPILPIGIFFARRLSPCNEALCGLHRIRLISHEQDRNSEALVF